MNGLANKLLWWIMGVLLVTTLSLSSVLFTVIEGRLDRMETNLQSIQAEYYRIAVLESQVSAVRVDVAELLKLARER